MAEIDASNVPPRRLKLTPRATVRLIIFGLLAISMIGYALEIFLLDNSTAKDITHSIAEGALVSFVLAATGDYYLRVRLAEDSVRRGVRNAISETFGFLDPAQPEALQSAVREFASSRVYLHTAEWRIRFDWEDRGQEILRVSTNVHSNGRSLYRDVYVPPGTTWVLDSTEPYRSRYLRYSVQCPQAGIDIDEPEDALQRYCTRRGGRLLLDRGQLLRDHLPPGRKILYGFDFNRTTSAVMFQRSTGYVPLTHSSFVIDLGIELSGNALQDLAITVFLPGRSGDDDVRLMDAATDQPFRYRWQNFNPGSTMILSWTAVDGA
jgi:hypothetical protein